MYVSVSSEYFWIYSLVGFDFDMMLIICKFTIFIVKIRDDAGSK